MPPPDLLTDLESVWAAQEAREKWLAIARPEQIPPEGDWHVFAAIAGRGWGKTRCGAEDVAFYALSNPEVRIAVVAPTAADARDTCVEGQSGLLSVLPRQCVALWNRSLGELILKNGARFKLFSSEEPERLRGPQFHRAWADELGAWTKAQATWDQLAFALRLGTNPQCIVTTTPKPTPLIRAILADPKTHVVRGSTFDNAKNLAPAALAKLRAKYEGTRLGRQELEAEVLSDLPNALWRRDMLEAARTDAIPQLARIVVGVDPSGSDGESGDRQGIIVAGVDHNGRGYVLEDASDRLSPEGWALRVAKVYSKWQADRVVAEANFGGALVTSNLRAVAPNLPVTLVSASRGKHVRAEPIAALFEQGRVSLFGAFPGLEDELCEFTTTGWMGRGSPDAADAMVWALSHLMLTGGGAQGWFDYYKSLVEAKHAPQRQAKVEVSVEASSAAPASPRLVRLRGRPFMSLTLHCDNDELTYVADAEGVVHAEPEHVRQLSNAGFRPLEGAHG